MGQNNTPFTLNGYSYADAKVTFDGIDLPGVTSFEFKYTQEKVNNYGMGKNPKSRSRKEIAYEGSMDMDYDTQTLLGALSSTGLLTDIPSGVMILSLVRADGGKEIVTMGFFEFQSGGIGGSTGDDELTISTDIIFGSYEKESF